MCVLLKWLHLENSFEPKQKKKAEVGVLLPISVVLVLREVTKKDLSVFANQTDGVSSVGGRYDRPRWQPYWLPLYDSFRFNNLFNVYAPIHTEYFTTCLLVVVGVFLDFLNYNLTKLAS